MLSTQPFRRSLSARHRPLPGLAFPRLCVSLSGIVMLLWLTACSPHRAGWKLDDIDGLMPDLHFSLTDGSGHTVHGSDFRGKLVMLYFGYTHCPDVCPTTLARLSQAAAALGKQTGAVRILFVSVDPARDTPASLKRYATAFGPDVVGLTGSQAALRALTKRYRVTYSLGKPNVQGDYEVTHSSAVFIFDSHGHSRLLARGTDSAAAITHDLKRLIPAT